jgi:hypothetical protein
MHATRKTAGAELADRSAHAQQAASAATGGFHMGTKHGPTIKDDRRYEHLRNQGMSKEKAARIANTPRKKAAKKGGASPKYEDWTRNDLYQKAKEVGIAGRSGMNRNELIKALRTH